MDESEWKTCDDPLAMLNALRGISTVRKLRLFACACCRRVWTALSDARSRRAVEVAESHADQRVDDSVLEAVKDAAYSVHADTSPPDSGFSNAATGMVQSNWEAAQAATTASMPCSTLDEAIWCCQAVSDQSAVASGSIAQEATADGWSDEKRRLSETNERKMQCQLLRCIFGPDPFASSPDLDPSCLNAAVIGLAKNVYETRTEPNGMLDTLEFEVLADALEDAGCDNAEILAHCRGPGPHVRGCWVVDLILGKK